VLPTSSGKGGYSACGRQHARHMSNGLHHLGISSGAFTRYNGLHKKFFGGFLKDANRENHFVTDDRPAVTNDAPVTHL